MQLVARKILSLDVGSSTLSGSIIPDVAQRQEANDLGSLQGVFESRRPD